MSVEAIRTALLQRDEEWKQKVSAALRKRDEENARLRVDAKQYAEAANATERRWAERAEQAEARIEALANEGEHHCRSRSLTGGDEHHAPCYWSIPYLTWIALRGEGDDHG